MGYDCLGSREFVEGYGGERWGWLVEDSWVYIGVGVGSVGYCEVVEMVG